MRRLLRWHETTNFSLERSGQLSFSAEQVASFSRKLVGKIVLPQDDDYPGSRSSFMSAFQHFPQIVVFCAGFSDVVHCIAFAKETGLRPVCRSGGHSTAGYSVNDGMVIDVSRLNYVSVDERAGLAWVGAGSHFAQINSTLELYGYHIPGGDCETVGVGGYMQGGGYSFTSLMCGLNIDNVVAFKMALADGRIVRASEEQNSDLYWAVRGGTGNNFGVLLEIQYKLVKLGKLWGFGFKWPIKDAANVPVAARAMAAWQQNFTGDAVPEKLGTEAIIVHTTGPGAKIPVPYAVIRGLYDGSAAACQKALAPLLDLMPDVKKYRDIWRAGSYSELNEYLMTHPTELPPNVPNSARSMAKSHIVARQLTVKEWSTIINLYRDSPNTDNFFGFEAYGGAVNAVAPEATAFWHRRASMDVFLFSFWLHEQQHDAAQTYVKDFDAVMKPLGNGHSYQNYPHRLQENFGEAYFGGNLPRLLLVKKKYDPKNFFNFDQGLSAILAGA